MCVLESVFIGVHPWLIFLSGKSKKYVLAGENAGKKCQCVAGSDVVWWCERWFRVEAVNRHDCTDCCDEFS